MSTTDPKAIVLGDDLVDSNTIDLGYGAVPPDYTNISYSSGTDTISIDPSWSTMTSSITLPSTYSTTIGVAGSTYTIANPGNYYNTTSNVNINSNGIDMRSGSDITIDGKSLKNFMDKMEERLAILVPDPAKLEKFEALKRAYEHYKLMEKLCQELPKEED
jgi:hypothetical protein